MPIELDAPVVMTVSMRTSRDTVTTSEIADWVHCPQAWRLSRTGHESADRFGRDAGTVRHAGKVAAERVAGGSIALGRILIVVALLPLLAWELRR